MKRLIFIISACLALMGAGHAQVSDLKLGYCPDELTGTSGISWSEANTDVSAAMLISEGTIATYQGNYISGINAGLASKLNLESLTVWVRSELDGPNLAEKTITAQTDQKIVKGWNAVEFDTPYLIPEKAGALYFGYTFHQKGAAFGVAATDTPADNAFYIKQGSGEWENRSESGMACIQAFVRGDKLPKVNLELTSITLPDAFIVMDGTLEVGGVVKNLATYSVSGFDVTAYSGAVRLDSKPVDMALAYGESGDFNVTFDIPTSDLTGDTLDLTITVENIKEGADEDTGDNSQSGTVNVVAYDFTHRILVEEFTTEKCPNCPRVGNYLHDLLETPEFADKVIAVCHHSGYYTDWLTAPFDNEYLWLFNAGGATYAPAVMVDRMTVEGKGTPVFNPVSKAELEQSFLRQLHKPAYVSLNITYDQTEYTSVDVHVKGECSVEQLCENPQITVYVVEDNINARNQAGASSGWVHQHVNRTVNATWGEPLEFVDGQYDYDCTLTLNNAWDRNNLKIVAFISNYNSHNAEDCPVLNAAQVDFTSTLGVDSVSESAEGEAEYFTLQGVKVADPESGIYICRRGSNVQKVIVK